MRLDIVFVSVCMVVIAGSAGAVAYSALGFSAYVYLLKHSNATHVSTYAFVNPVVALFLGWSLGGQRSADRRDPSRSDCGFLSSLSERDR